MFSPRGRLQVRQQSGTPVVPDIGVSIRTRPPSRLPALLPSCDRQKVPGPLIALLNGARRQLASLVVACSVAGACAPSYRMAEVPQVPACRGAVDTRGSAGDVSVTWWAPQSVSDRHRHLAWCDTVGPTVVASADGALESPPVANTLAIVSWNTHVGGGDIPALVADLRSGRWTRGRPARHFVLLLQEVFREGPKVPPTVGRVPSAIRPSRPPFVRADVVRTAEMLGLHLFYAPSMRNGATRPGVPDEDRGNAILSTLPLSEYRAIELPFERQRRVAISARIALSTPLGEAMPLLLVSVHLDSRAPARRAFVLAPPARTRQMKGLLDALPDGGPAALGGDLNTWFGAAEGAYAEALRAFPDTPSGRGATVLRLFRLDHLFFRLPDGWTARWRVLRDAFGSDHRPILGEIIRANADKGSEKDGWSRDQSHLPVTH